MVYLLAAYTLSEAHNIVELFNLLYPLSPVATATLKNLAASHKL